MITLMQIIVVYLIVRYYLWYIIIFGLNVFEKPKTKIKLFMTMIPLSEIYFAIKIAIPDIKSNIKDNITYLKELK